ncbi:hypothetical protein BJF96_g1957 [Verticillium dahliae]|nr:hypothetical protein BJF96_g10463 [Verticillium dahliae]PNH26225.1 hypothetical protein BJF96_g10459 [Verticillium dahliae]PNH26235.1 hypothetical protein BJF96_g10449 [Verticillium dahliae]PNH26257.1 hypothetical protein BJF96_g10426 [Verticillium dahliae]PNH26263.1 hypothetical protein BJF96_g10423 [Verticillium dahliae]
MSIESRKQAVLLVQLLDTPTKRLVTTLLHFLLDLPNPPQAIHGVRQILLQFGQRFFRSLLVIFQFLFGF